MSSSTVKYGRWEWLLGKKEKGSRGLGSGRGDSVALHWAVWAAGLGPVALTLSLQPSFWHSFLTRAPMMIITVSLMSLLAKEPLNLLCRQAGIEQAIRTLQHSKGTLSVSKVTCT